MCAITENEPRERRVSVVEAAAAAASNHPAQEDPRPRQPHTEDFLAKFTYGQKMLMERANSKFQSYCAKLRFALGSSQSAHVIVVGLILVVASFYIPAAYTHQRPSAFTTLLYLASICIHIGDQFWMTFISGVVLYFNIPRHAFGAVQKVLFPKYFAINSFLSALTLITFARIHSFENYAYMQWVQLVCMSSCFLIELGIRVYLAPDILRLMDEKTLIEKSEPGVGEEIGHFAPGRLANCPHYMKLHRTFRRLHMKAAIGNIISMACTTMQLVYLQQNYNCLAS